MASFGRIYMVCGKMKFVVILSFAALLCQGTGTFDSTSVGDPNAFDLTRVLDCEADVTGRLNVSLVQPEDGSFNSYWLPEVSE